MFQREDWELFTQLGTLTQKAGVPMRMLAPLAVKELVDNAYDASGECEYTVRGRTVTVENPGDIPGDNGTIAHLFSVRRSMISTKLLRRPSRGALGNGLRVVAGVVLASGGKLRVTTGGRTLRLTPQDDGTTAYVEEGPAGEPGVTRVEITFGSTLDTEHVSHYAARSATLEPDRGSKHYQGKTSPWWYDSDAFHGLCRAAKGMALPDFAALFRLDSATEFGEIDAVVTAEELDRGASSRLLLAMRARSKPVPPAALGHVGRGAFDERYAYAKGDGLFRIAAGRGGEDAVIPFVVECWMKPLGEDDGTRPAALVSVNRTAVTASITSWHDKSDNTQVLGGCELPYFKVGRKPFHVWLNVITPYQPITTDGKEPDFGAMSAALVSTLEKCARAAKKMLPTGERAAAQKDVIAEALPEAIEKASDFGRYPFSLRQLFYAVRPEVLTRVGKEPDYGYFASVITDYERARGDIEGMYRDPRGTLYHPHTREEIPLGTVNVAAYRRPAHTFKHVLYCEKEGLFPLLKSTGWPERNDCALMSSKGFASRAARDLIDLLGETAEELVVFAIHDADGPGTMIFQALVEGTRARGARKVKVINLGLEPEEGREMGLQVEGVERKKGSVPVAAYVPEEDRDWLQTHRIELNAMTTAEFVAWLDRKVKPHFKGKVVPPETVMRRELDSTLAALVRSELSERVLREAGLDALVAGELARLAPRADRVSVEREVKTTLRRRPEQQWSAAVSALAQKIKGGDGADESA